jgi:hypothetical protein
MPSKSIDIYTPSGTVSYTELSGGVSQINVRYQFANVVDIRIYFSDLSLIRFYQVACKVTTTP